MNTSIETYRLKNPPVAAMQYDGTIEANHKVIEWLKDSPTLVHIRSASFPGSTNGVQVLTLDNKHIVQPSNYLVKYDDGSAYIMQERHFLESFEKVSG